MLRESEARAGGASPLGISSKPRGGQGSSHGPVGKLRHRTARGLPRSHWRAAGRRAEPDSRAPASPPPRRAPSPHLGWGGRRGALPGGREPAPRSALPQGDPVRLLATCRPCPRSEVLALGRAGRGGLRRGAGHCSGGICPVGQFAWSRCSHSGQLPAAGSGGGAPMGSQAPWPSTAAV